MDHNVIRIKFFMLALKHVDVICFYKERQEQAKIHEQQQKLKAAEEKRLEEERARREEERKQEEYAKVKRQQIMERVKTLAETDVGKKAFKGLTSEVVYSFQFYRYRISSI